MSNAFDMSYSHQQGKQILDERGCSELIISNKVGVLVFTEYLDRDIRLKEQSMNKTSQV